MPSKEPREINPPQHQAHQPGQQRPMHPQPESVRSSYRAADKLRGKVAVITGGDSGIGRAVALTFALEGADVVIGYLEENQDARDAKAEIEKAGGKAHVMAGDVGNPEFCTRIIDQTIATFGRLDIVVNNAAEQHPQESIADISTEQLEKTFRTNIFSMFHLVKAALPHLQAGARIINTASVTAYRGSPGLLDYSATKGAIVAFTRSLALQLAEKGILVNAVAPGPIWTPLIPSTFSAEDVAQFGSKTPLKRPGQPSEIAPAYVYLACEDSSYMSGQVLHLNGGEIING